MEIIRGLYFVDRLRHGGIQTFILENLRNMDPKQIKIDILVLDDGNTYQLEDKFRRMGCSVYKLKGIWIDHIMDYWKYKKSLDDFFEQHPTYQFVHLHGSSKNFIVLAAAKKHGIKVRIAHSHNVGFQTTSKFKKIAGQLSMWPLRYYATDFFACSFLAGKWLFGRKIAESSLQIIHNAIDMKRFYYDKETDGLLKEKYGIEGKIVVGHVGRFTDQKNHLFLIKIFAEIVKKREDVVLILVGAGELEKTVKKEVKALGLSEMVIFAGYQADVVPFMRMMDVFVFPSIYEGLGLVLIEAQALGLPCIASADVIPEEAGVSSLLQSVRLTDTPEHWADAVLTAFQSGKRDVRKDICEKGYNIQETAAFLQDYYRKKCVL